LNIEQFVARFNQLQQSQSGIIIWIFLVVLAIATAGLVLRWLEAQAEKSHNLWDDAVVRAIRAPALVLLWVVGISWVGEVIRSASDATVFEFIAPLRDNLVIGTLTWFVVRFIKYAEQAWISQHPRDQAMDQETIHTLGRLLRTAIIVTAVLVTMQTLGYNISGVLALGSIGGIALSFASKDMLANFFWRSDGLPRSPVFHRRLDSLSRSGYRRYRRAHWLAQHAHSCV
jgi:MscS family membrane protein